MSWRKHLDGLKSIWNTLEQRSNLLTWSAKWPGVRIRSERNSQLLIPCWSQTMEELGSGKSHKEPSLQGVISGSEKIFSHPTKSPRRMSIWLICWSSWMHIFNDSLWWPRSAHRRYRVGHLRSIEFWRTLEKKLAGDCSTNWINLMYFQLSKRTLRGGYPTPRTFISRWTSLNSSIT